MKINILKVLPVQAGEWKFVLPLLVLLALNTMVIDLSDVVATAGFISNVGVPGMLWLWSIGVTITLVAASGYSMFVDRVQRVRLMIGLMVGVAIILFVVQLMFNYGAPDWLTYPILFILYDQQDVFFPLAFWALANDTYSLSEGKRLFPIIAAGASIGSILGNSLASASAFLISQWGGGISQLLLFASGIMLLGALLVWFAYRNQPPRVRQARANKDSVIDTFRVGFDYFTHLKSFSYLAITMMCSGLALCIIEFHFLFTSGAQIDSGMGLQAFLGIYRNILIVSILVFQSFVTSRLLGKVVLKNAFFVLPLAILAGFGLVIFSPGLFGVAAGRFIVRFVQRIWDNPSRKAVQALVPDERRGRVSAFMDSYFYSIATLVGCALLGGIIYAASIWLNRETASLIYLMVGVVAALVAIWSSFRMRAEYERSLLDWRFARSRRKSVLDKIEF